MERKKILVIMTGGTICATTNKDGIRQSDAENAKIIDTFKKGDSLCRDTDFDKKIPLDILSENMTAERWNILLGSLRNVSWEDYAGIIILHGTDTLAYTASLLSAVLAGSSVPVFLVSSQLPLDHKEANGNANFRTAAELICGGIAPNVYAVYRNSDNRMYLHYGAHLRQCASYSDDFFSTDMTDVTDGKIPNCQSFAHAPCYLHQMGNVRPCVLYIAPYVGLDYEAIPLTGIRAVVHGTFHTQAVCVERSKGKSDYSKFSVLHLLDRCRQADIPLFLAPCSEESYCYESTGDAISCGALPTNGLTAEAAYTKAMLGCALGYSGKRLADFMKTPIG